MILGLLDQYLSCSRLSLRERTLLSRERKATIAVRAIRKRRETHEHNSNIRYRRFPRVHFTRLRLSSNSFRRSDELQRRRIAGCLF